jgi:hypothetical protein
MTIVDLVEERLVNGGREGDSTVRVERGTTGGGRAFRCDESEAWRCGEGAIRCGINLTVKRYVGLFLEHA